jgi:hypothetical protein
MIDDEVDPYDMLTPESLLLLAVDAWLLSYY